MHVCAHLVIWVWCVGQRSSMNGVLRYFPPCLVCFVVVAWFGLVLETLSFETGLSCHRACCLKWACWPAVGDLSPPLSTGRVLKPCLGSEEQTQILILRRCFSKEAILPTHESWFSNGMFQRSSIFLQWICIRLLSEEASMVVRVASCFWSIQNFIKLCIVNEIVTSAPNFNLPLTFCNYCLKTMTLSEHFSPNFEEMLFIPVSWLVFNRFQHHEIRIAHPPIHLPIHSFCTVCQVRFLGTRETVVHGIDTVAKQLPQGWL